MATYADDFNRADNSLVNVDWAEDDGSGGALRIIDNQLGCNSEGGETVGWGFIRRDESYDDDQFSEIEYRSHTVSMYYPRSGPAVRIQGTSTSESFTGYAADCRPEDGIVAIRKFVSQNLAVSLGTLLAEVAEVTFTAGDKFRIEAEGSIVRVKRNGVVIVFATDDVIVDGYPGVVTLPGYFLG